MGNSLGNPIPTINGSVGRDVTCIVDAADKINAIVFVYAAWIQSCFRDIYLPIRIPSTISTRIKPY